MKTLFNPSSSGSNTLFVRHLACLLLLLGSTGAYANITVSTTALQVVFNTTDCSLTVTDLINSDVWTQEIPTGFSVYSSSQISGRRFQATINAPGTTTQYTIDLKIDDAPATSFTVTLTPSTPLTTDPYPYIYLPPYPFMFAGTGSGTWYYLQNNGGEGTLIPLDNTSIRARGGWTGSQPWWGVTDLTKAMMARLDTFARIQPNYPTETGDISAYQIPMIINYSFYHTNGYVQLAKAYRTYFLGQNPSLHTLQYRADNINADLAFLKDATYAYFWDDNALTFATLLSSMKTAGLTRMIAMFNLHDDPNRLVPSMTTSIVTNGWLPGLYRQPTPNLQKICDLDNWVVQLLTGDYSESDILTHNANEMPPVNNWDDLYTTDTAPQWTDTDVPGLLTTYGDLRLIYHDTLPQQVAPCIDDADGFRESIQTNQSGRQSILDGTHTNGLIAGSGEGVSAFWTIPHLDYWEGGMEESTYADINRSPISDHNSDFASDTYPGTSPTWYTQESNCLDETAASGLPGTRIPLLALQWHDYEAETWNWRNSTFVVQSLSWKKDLFNILYCAMPMWHVDAYLWNLHSAEYIASYKKLLPVRQANGFAEMTDHHFVDGLNGEVQSTYWSNGNRVVANFGGTNYSYSDGTYSGTIPSHGYEMFPDSTPPAPVPTFTATPGNTQITLNWTNPPDGDLVSVKIKRSTNTYPTWTTGTEIYNGSNLTLVDTGKTNGRTYYYSAFAIDGVGNYSTAMQVSAVPNP
jgi:hypothetical protein